MDNTLCYIDKIGYNISAIAGESYNIDKKKKKSEKYYLGEIEKVRNNCLNKIINNDNIRYRFDIRNDENKEDRKFTVVKFSKQAKMYNYFVLYYELIKDEILPIVKDKIVEPIDIIIRLYCYKGVRYPDYWLRVNMGDQDLISINDYYFAEKYVKNEKITLKEACRKSFWLGQDNNFSLIIKEEVNKICEEYGRESRSGFDLKKWDGDWLKIRYK